MKVTLHEVSKTIRGVTVLDRISLELEGGNVYGVQGKNGCGKTMLMRTICGLIRPTSGSIFLNDKILGKDISFPHSVGVLIENPSFLNGYTGFQNLKMLSDLRDHLPSEKICDTLSRVGLDPADKRVYRKYSLGMKQKLGIAAAVMGDPELVILDEPINAIDETGVQNVRDILHDLKKKGSVIIIACHDREELEQLSDQIFKIESGRIIA